jgi:hypothetical protein
MASTKQKGEMTKKNGEIIDWLVCLFGGALAACAFGFAGLAAGNRATQMRVELNKDLATILSVVQVKPDPELTMEPTVGRGGLVTSPDRKYSAYILCVPVPTQEDPERCAHRVHFEENTKPRAEKIDQIRGESALEEVTRPVDFLKWVNNYTLSYERWSGPHFGHRYVIDVRTRKQVAAYDLVRGQTRL